MKKSCEKCGQEFTRPPSQMGRFCGTRCAYAARRKEVTEHRRIRYLPSHPLSGSTGLVSAARAILYDRIGPGWHECHWCRRKVRWLRGVRGNNPRALVADHVDSDPLNDAPGNIVPSCGTCNGTRTQQIEPTEFFVMQSGHRTRATRRVCLICKAQFLVATAQLRTPGKGLCCSRSCARRLPKAAPY
jgi:hypothetical protein